MTSDLKTAIAKGRESDHTPARISSLYNCIEELVGALEIIQTGTANDIKMLGKFPWQIAEQALQSAAEKLK